MANLHLVVNKKWFDQIFSGEKIEEYREVKPFWEKRLSKEFSNIDFQLGYSKNAPRMIVEKKYIEIKKITHEHFNNKEIEVFAIGLGKILNTRR